MYKIKVHHSLINPHVSLHVQESELFLNRFTVNLNVHKIYHYRVAVEYRQCVYCREMKCAQSSIVN